MPVCGEVERLSLEELAQLETPPATRTFYPIPHSRVMDMVLTTLDMLRLKVRGMDLAVARNGDRFFGTLGSPSRQTVSVSNPRLATSVRGLPRG